MSLQEIIDKYSAIFEADDDRDDTDTINDNDTYKKNKEN